MIPDEIIRFLCILGIILSFPCAIFVHYETEGFWPATIIMGFALGVGLSWFLYCVYGIFYVAITGGMP